VLRLFFQPSDFRRSGSCPSSIRECLLPFPPLCGKKPVLFPSFGEGVHTFFFNSRAAQLIPSFPAPLHPICRAHSFSLLRSFSPPSFHEWVRPCAGPQVNSLRFCSPFLRFSPVLFEQIRKLFPDQIQKTVSASPFSFSPEKLLPLATRPDRFILALTSFFVLGGNLSNFFSLLRGGPR